MDDGKVMAVIGGNGEFYQTKGGFLGLKLEGKDIGRVDAYRMFPMSRADTYISIFDKDKKEVGMIPSLSVLDENAQTLIKTELDRRYFLPEILKINDIKEEFNYTFFKVETNAGKRDFTVFDMNASLINLGNGSIMLNDIDGNKYLMHDITSKGKKALRYLEIWL